MYRHPRLRHQLAHAATHGLPSFCIWERICRPQFCWLGESAASAGEREVVCARVRAGESASQSDPVSESDVELWVGLIDSSTSRLFRADSWTCRSSIEPDWPVICNRLGGLSRFKSPLNDLIDARNAGGGDPALCFGVPAGVSRQTMVVARSS